MVIILNSYYTVIVPEDSRMNTLLRSINNTKNMIRVFQAFRKIQLRSGKAKDSPEVIYIDKKIFEFESDLRTMQNDDVKAQ